MAAGQIFEKAGGQCIKGDGCLEQTSQKNHVARVYVLLAVDLLSIIISYVLAVAARFGIADLEVRKVMHYMICLCFMLFCTMFGLFMDWNRDFSKRGYLVELSMVIRNNVIMFVAVGCFLFLIKQAEFFRACFLDILLYLMCCLRIYCM